MFRVFALYFLSLHLNFFLFFLNFKALFNPIIIELEIGLKMFLRTKFLSEYSNNPEILPEKIPDNFLHFQKPALVPAYQRGLVFSSADDYLVVLDFEASYGQRAYEDLYETSSILQSARSSNHAYSFPEYFRHLSYISPVFTDGFRYKLPWHRKNYRIVVSEAEMRSYLHYTLK